MPQRRPSYHCVAGVEPNNIKESDPESVMSLWRNLPSSSGVASVPIKTTLTRVSNFMSSDVTETSCIPLGSCRQAQQSPAIRLWIGAVVVDTVRYGASGPLKNAGPWPISPARPAEQLGAGPVILLFPAPAPGPARSPDRSPLKQVGRNVAPSRE